MKKHGAQAMKKVGIGKLQLRIKHRSNAHQTQIKPTSWAHNMCV